jgi:DNA (cytosine-5)-methyltransferase 1
MVALSWDYFDSQCFIFPQPNGTELVPLRDLLNLEEKAPEDHYFDPDGRWGRLFRESMDAGKSDNLYHLRRYYVREAKNGASPTLTANMGEGGHNVPVCEDPWGIRRLTTNECLRLQGFDPDHFKFPDEISRSQRYKQIGNAVTAKLVELLANECIRILRTGAQT